ncbi:MAG: sulfatase-like hydrolase/transferase [Paludibacteraceae bacterium]|nr:sulfatase-like hydrolase/transferase [Paludibacteraceae bacterium]
MTPRYLQPLWHSIRYLLYLHVLALCAMTFCRLILLWSNMPAEGIDYALLFRALLIGVKFDNLIACYVQALPVVVLTIATLSTLQSKNGPWIVAGCMRGIAWWEGILFAIILIVEVANARYFHFFDNHLNYEVTEWFGFAGDTAGMMLQDTTNLWFLLIAVGVITIYEWVLVRLTQRSIAQQPSILSSTPIPVRSYIQGGLICVLLYGLVFVGIRGSLQRYPLKVSFAYFCDKPFYNKLGVNPVFNIVKTAENGKNKLPDFLTAISVQEAEEYVQSELLRPLTDTLAAPVVLTSRPNVVLILMESMTSANLERQYNGQYLTPYLRSLRDSSLYWSNAFSAGIHTNNGIVASQYGYVPNFARAMMDVNANHYTGLPYYLQQAGYHNLAFVTGNPQYDNMNSFWRENHIPLIYSLYDYEEAAVVNNFGVPDDYMFRFGLDKLAAQTEPFFATFLTVSNHTPYVVPEAFRSRGKKDEERIIAYADDAIRQFMTTAQATEWGKNTLFILVADHGAPLPSPYEMLLSYNSIPVYFVGAGLQPQRMTHPASQIDIWATVLGMLGIPYDNSTLGIDIQRNERRYAFFVSNEHLGVSDGEWFWCYGVNSRQEHLYRIGSDEDVKDRYPEQADDMRRFGTCMQRANLERMEQKKSL